MAVPAAYGWGNIVQFQGDGAPGRILIDVQQAVAIVVLVQIIRYAVVIRIHGIIKIRFGFLIVGY